MKLLLFILIVSMSFCGVCQSGDTTKHVPKKNTSLIALELGQSNYNFTGYRGEANISYTYIRKHLLGKFCIGIAPSTFYGNIYKISLGVGYSTRIDKIISWNIHGGLLKGKPSKPQVGNYEKFTGNGPYYLESELCVNPLKSKKIIFGIGGTVFKSQFYTPYFKVEYLDFINGTIYLSFKYKLK